MPEITTTRHWQYEVSTTLCCCYCSLNIYQGSDPHQDTPLELLHTKLLGDDEFLWTATSKGWNKQQDDLFAARLQSSSLDGLSISSLRADYMVHYKGSLIGRHFKALQQLGAFHLHEGLCDKLFMDLWKVSGELGALLWYPEISNMPEYLVSLPFICCDVFLPNLLLYHRMICRF